MNSETTHKCDTPRKITIEENKRYFYGQKYQLRLHQNENCSTAFDLTEGELIGLKIMLEEKFPSVEDGENG